MLATATGNSVPRSGHEKKLYLEALRIVALFWVFYNHTGPYGWLLFREWPSFLPNAPSKLELCINLILFVFCKISVPLYLMISGAVLLGKSESLADLLKKRVLRFIILIVVVTAANGYYYYHLGHYYMDGITTLWDFVKRAWESTDFCTYYLFMYLGFLLALPLLRALAQKRELIPYIVVVYILFQEVLPVFQSAAGLGFNNMNPYIGGFSEYYILPLLGYYIDTLPDSFFSKKKCRYMLLAAGSILLLAVGVSYWYSSAKNVIMPWLPCLFPALILYFFIYIYIYRRKFGFLVLF